MRRAAILVVALAAMALAAACPGRGPPDQGSHHADGGSGSNHGPSDGGGTASPPDAGTILPGPGPDAGPFEWPLPVGPVAITPSPDWKNDIQAPDDPFRNAAVYSEEGGGQIRWVKFVVLVRDPSKVYFQDSTRYPFHAPFAVERLDPFKGKTVAQLDQLSLYEAGQEAILGAVLFPPRADILEYGIQLARKDPYHPEMARIVLELVRAHVQAPAGTRPFYFPVYEQAASAQAWAAFFEGHGVPVSSTDRWAKGNSCYAKGWALGRLKYFPAAEIAAAWSDGRLSHQDILLTDQVPAELPFLAGIVSLAPATPSSHVAILAGSYRIPFVHLALAPDVAAAQALAAAGGEVVLRAGRAWGDALSACEVKIIDVEGKLGDAPRAELLALKQEPPLDFVAKQPAGTLAASTDGLRPTDIGKFGGKAANFGMLRQAIPASSPVAVALSFDLWDQFMAQPVAGRPLSAVISERLSGHVWPPADRVALASDLAYVRALIQSEGDFDAAQRQAVLSALAVFQPDRKLQLRSSTNVEDSATFTGAGLYDSHSGCLADDVDSDDDGPSRCDAGENGERGVFRALKRVYASFYNENAYLERLRRQVDESKVAMGVLVHHSFPDASELANGVATAQSYGTSFRARLVTQAGAVSVTNPEGGAIPEVVEAASYSFGTYPELRQGSSLVPLGATVMEWEADYVALTGLLQTVAQEYAAWRPAPPQPVLDFEYKKMAGSGLVVKQVRELPAVDPNQSQDTFLVNEPLRRCVFQGEYGDVFATHRLKSRWSIETVNGWLRPADLQNPLLARVEVGYVTAAGGGTSTFIGDATGFADGGHEVNGSEVTERWTTEAGAREHAVTISLETQVGLAESPVRTLSDFSMYYTVTYLTPVVALDWQGQLTTRTSDTVRLVECSDERPLTSLDLLQTRTLAGANGVTITTSFWWPEPPAGASAGYTAPAVKFEQTVIEGLTSSPITLRGYYSQTYRPEHHNFGESFAFEPRLEEGIDPALIAELDALDVATVVVGGQYSAASGALLIVGLDGALREQ